jgi:pyridoxamine 5'-phosphate oxidase
MIRHDDEPLVLFRRWYARARRAGIPLPDAMALATADAKGRPSVRFVLLKGADSRGFVFFTDARSRKGRDLRTTGRAAAVFYWHPIGKQVRIAGPVEEVTAAEADAYWRTRPRASRLAALASSQSAALASRADLLTRWRELHATHRGHPVPRPRAWTGFRIRPEEIEFWTRSAHRLHRRERYTRRAGRWVRTLLQP